MKKLFTYFLLLISFQSLAQHYAWQAFGQSVISGYNIGTSVLRDNASNLYVTSAFSGLIQIQGDTLPNPGAGLADIYLAKFNSEGKKIRVINFGGGFISEVFSMCIDDSANIYLFFNANNAPVIFPDTTLSMSGTIMVSFDSTANFRWACQLPYVSNCGKYCSVSKNYLFVESCYGLHKISLDSGIILNTINYNIGPSQGMCVTPNGDLVMIHNNNIGTLTLGGITITSTASPTGAGGNLVLLRIDTALNVKALKAYGTFAP